MAVKLQLRYDTAANWTSNNPTLLAGEIAIESDTKKMKVGDGTTAWASLAYAFVTSGSPAITTSITTSSTSFDLLNTTATTVNFAGAATTLNLGATTGTTTIKNALDLATGTATLAPIQFTAGTNLTTPIAGTIEYDGTSFYKTNGSAIRAAAITSHIYKKATTTTLASATTNQSILNATAASAATGIALAAGTTYEFEVRFTLTTSGTVSHTEAVGFYYSGSTSFYSYEAERRLANVATSATIYAQAASGTTLASNVVSTVMTPAITTAQTNAMYTYRGWVTTNTAGNWTPVIVFSAALGGTSTIGVGATIKITPLQSTSGVVNISGWA
jgi:hypothetical protein